MVALSALVLCLADVGGGSFRVTSAADLVVSGMATQVVATSRHIFAVVGGALVVVDAEGRIVRRMPLPQAPKQASSDPRIAKAAADRALFEQYGFPEHLRTSRQAERWLEDIKSRKDRTQAPDVGIGAAPADASQADWLLEANLDKVFLGNADGLWMLDDAQEAAELRRVTPLPRKPRGLAVSLHGVVNVRTADTDFMLDAEAVAPHIEPCTAIAPDIDEMVVLDGRRASAKQNFCSNVTRVARADRALWVGAGTTGATRLPVSASSLTSCGAYALVNAAEGLFALSAQRGLTKLGPPAPYAQIRCLPAFPDAVVSFDLAGDGVKVSADGGTTWAQVSAGSAEPSSALVFTENAVWVATNIGLLRLSKEEVGVREAVPRAHMELPQRSPWVGLLPTVHITGMWSEGEGAARRQSAATMVSAEFPLQAPSPPQAPAPNTGRSTRATASDGATLPLREKPPACLANLRGAAARLALAEPERMRAMIARTRTAAWFPELRMRAEKRWGRNQSVDLDSETTLAPLGLDTVNDFRLEVRASWDLARLVYSPDELAASVASVRVADARQEVGALVNRLFFARRQKVAAAALDQRMRTQATTTALSPTSSTNEAAPEGDDAQASVALLRDRIAHLSADLDALTGGLAGECW